MGRSSLNLNVRASTTIGAKLENKIRKNSIPKGGWEIS